MLKKYEELFEVRDELMMPGGRSCPGCGGGIMTRFFLKAAKATGKGYVMPFVGSCGTNTTSMFPLGPMAQGGVVVGLLGGIGAIGSGVREALNKTGREDALVIGIVGDGDAADISFGNVSAMIERGHKVAVVVQDNQSYSATGGHRSGTTPLLAWTRTTHKGKKQYPKILPFAYMAHEIPYTAMASIAYPEDMYAKFKKAMLPENQPAIVQALSVCVTNWRTETHRTLEVARLATETGLYPLFEYEHGKFTTNCEPKEYKPIQDYVKLQGRYDHITDDGIKQMEEFRDWLAGKLEGYKRMYNS